MMSRKVAFVTGASRGIGKAIAIHLAKAGFDVAITARTVREGEAREHSPTVKHSDTSALPGSLESTADLIRKEGRDVLPIAADITEPATLGFAAATALERWGGVDVVVHNARYIGAGHMDAFIDTPMEQIEKHIEGNVLATLRLNKFFIPSMIARGGGSIINMTSGSGFAAPPAPAGQGGWGMCYGVSKSAVHRIVGILAVELADKNIRAYNVDPGFIATERIAQDMAKFGFDASAGTPADVPAAVVAWLATSPEAPKYSGETVHAQYFCRDRKLLPSWNGQPAFTDPPLKYDTAPQVLSELESAELARRR
ncbi:MAG TPA: SDR family oxidoreductase [Burkholderiales bacterium]|nr:SDR family oxidoreductase [Burkholderiales bacterium]